MLTAVSRGRGVAWVGAALTRGVFLKTPRPQYREFCVWPILPPPTAHHLSVRNANFFLSKEEMYNVAADSFGMLRRDLGAAQFNQWGLSALFTGGHPSRARVQVDGPPLFWMARFGGRPFFLTEGRHIPRRQVDSVGPSPLRLFAIVAYLIIRCAVVPPFYNAI